VRAAGCTQSVLRHTVALARQAQADLMSETLFWRGGGTGIPQQRYALCPTAATSQPATVAYPCLMLGYARDP
jgi:hypothetical protein